MIQIKTVVDESTGEVVYNSEKKYSPFTDKGFTWRTKNYSVKQYQDVRLSEFVTDEREFARIHKVAEYLYKDTNTVMIRESQRKVRYATIEDISKIIGLCERRTLQFINKMKRMEIIAECKTQLGETEIIKFVINPLFFNCSKYLSADLYFTFQNTLNHYLPSWVITKFHEVGNIVNDRTQ